MIRGLVNLKWHNERGNEMKIGKAFPSKYVAAADLEGRDPAVMIIRACIMENVAPPDAPVEEKPVLYFEKANRGVVLNKTRAAVVAALYGDETDHWNGKSITVFSDMTMYMGKSMPCVSLRGPHTTSEPADNGADDPFAGAAPASPVEEGDIPF